MDIKNSFFFKKFAQDDDKYKKWMENFPHASEGAIDKLRQASQSAGYTSADDWRSKHSGGYTFGLDKDKLSFSTPYHSIYEYMKAGDVPEAPVPPGWNPDWGIPTREDWLKSYNLPEGFNKGSYDQTVGMHMPDGSSYSGQYPTKPKVGDTWSEADVPIAGIGNPSVQAITSPSVAYIKDVEEKRAKENTDYIPGGYTAWLSGDRTSPAAKKYMEIRDRDSQEEQQAAQDDRAKFFSSAGVSPIAATTGGAYQFGTGAGSSMSNMFKDPSFISWLQSGKNSMMMQYLFGGFGKGGNK